LASISTPAKAQSDYRFLTWEWAVYTLSQHWLAIFLVLWGIYVILPFLAPVFMEIGWTLPGHSIYFIYSFLCHQLPERSFFLFGHQTMYTLGEIQAAYQNTINPLVLRQFIGNAQMGWKVAWSDRMVSMYTSILFFGILWGWIRRRTNGKRPGHLSIWGFGLSLLPMAVDGFSHLFSDLQGFEQGFRQNNLWLVHLTHGVLPAWFYAGNALGSFNSDMRLLTGIIFGLGVVWFAFPYLAESFSLLAESWNLTPANKN
jgi:uncharacterized membrane protein